LKFNNGYLIDGNSTKYIIFTYFLLRAATTGNMGGGVLGGMAFAVLMTYKQRERVREVASYLRYLLSKSRVDILKMFIAPSWRAFYDAIRVKEQFLLTLLHLPPLPSSLLGCSVIRAWAWIVSFMPSTRSRRQE